MAEHDPDTDEAVAGGVYSAVGFASPEGDVIVASVCPLPVGFAHRVANDPDGLGREVDGRTFAVGGELVESGPITVDGRAGFYRIVRLPMRTSTGEVPNAAYVVGLVVPLEDDLPT